jgi:WhiB family transcriptional regulator, redox-sensing transcriptional regulator
MPPAATPIRTCSSPISTTGAALRQIEEAKRICRARPAQTQCLARARETGVTDGVRGGTTEDARRVIRSLSGTKTISKEKDNDKSYHPAEHGEHGIRAQAAQS